MSDEPIPAPPGAVPPPAPPLPEAPPPIAPGGNDSVGRGVLRLLLLHLWQIPLTVVGGPLWIGLSQLAYVIPQSLSYRKQGKSESLKGLWIGAGVTFLLNAGCFGLVFYSMAHTNFH